MAVFDVAFDQLRELEGGYVDHPIDRGGETFRGISRRFHPDWSGWEQIDALRKKSNFPRSLENDEVLPRLVRQFYLREYWHQFSGDDIPSQAIAEELLDTGVNLGVRRAVRFLQQSLNLLNRNARDYPDVVEDGHLGPVTLRTLKINLKRDATTHFLLKLMNIQQGDHYIQFMRQDPPQEVFARGWLNRT